MPFAINEKSVVPVLPTAGSLFDVAQVDRSVSEHAQHIHQSPRLVGRDEHDRRLVFATWLRLLRTDDQEASDVVGFVLDIREDGLHPINLTRQFRSDRRGIGLVRRMLDRG